MRKIAKIEEKNILLSIPYRVRDKEKFESVLDEFEKNGYIIYKIEDTNKDEVELEFIGEKIKEIKFKYGEESNIVYISNIRDLSYCAYRAYSGAIGAFIYFMDKINYDILTRSEKKEFYERLAGLNCLKNEKINTKLYIVFKEINIEKEIDRLIINNNFNNISEYKKFEDFKLTRRKSFKNYEYNGNSYIYYVDGKIEERITISEEEGEVLNYELLDQNSWFLLYFIIGVLRKYGIKMARDLFIPYFKYLQKKSEVEKIDLIKSITENKEFKNIDFKEKMAIMSLFILIETKNSKYSSELILKEIIADNGKNVQGYYYMLINILNSIRANNLIINREFYSECKKILNKTNEYYKSITDEIEIKENNEKIVLIAVDELKLLNHSGTKFALDMARKIKRNRPEYRVIIYCEENFYGSQEENYFINSMNSNPNMYSFSYRGIHESYLAEGGLKIEVYYSENPRDYKKNRLREYIDKVIEINPEIILTTSFCSFSIDLINSYFPTIYFSLGGINCGNEFDLLIYPHKNELLNYMNEFNIEFNENRVVGIDYMGEFRKVEVIADKSKYGISEDDFVMISVGRNIKYEITQEYAEKILNMLEKNKNMKWIIVGSAEIPEIDNKNIKDIDKKIIKINFSRALGSLYRISNIYLNPPRDGGGFSMAEAIVNDIPIVSLEYMAAKIYTDIRFKNMEEYIEEIEKIHKNVNYRKEILERQKKIMNENTENKEMETLFNIINSAKQWFKLS